MFINLDNPIVERKTKTVYRDGDKTVKLFVENYSKADILNEALNQARVEEGTDLNIPKLIEVSKIDNRWALVFEHKDGETMAQMLENNPEKEEEILNKFVDIQLNILSKTVPLGNRMKEKYKRKINSLDITDNIRYELLQRLDGMKDHVKLCHGDFNPSNIVINEKGEVSILDCAHVIIGNATSDAATTQMQFIMDGKNDRAEKYLEIFSVKSGINKNLVQRWIPIVAASRKAKGIEEEKEILDRWLDVLDYT